MNHFSCNTPQKLFTLFRFVVICSWILVFWVISLVQGNYAISVVVISFIQTITFSLMIMIMIIIITIIISFNSSSIINTVIIVFLVVIIIIIVKTITRSSFKNVDDCITSLLYLALFQYLCCDNIWRRELSSSNTCRKTHFSKPVTRFHKM